MLFRSFVRELRDLILRATERGWTPEDLAKQGKALGEEFWVAASNFWNSYIGTLIMSDVTHGETKERMDSAQIVWKAANATKPGTSHSFKNRFKSILVDEFQESDKAQRALLQNLSNNLSPVDLVIAVDEYTTVGRFRGADPEGLSEALAHYEKNGVVIHLAENFRASSSVHLFLEKVAGQFKKAPAIQSSNSNLHNAGSVIAEC